MAAANPPKPLPTTAARTGGRSLIGARDLRRHRPEVPDRGPARAVQPRLERGKAGVHVLLRESRGAANEIMLRQPRFQRMRVVPGEQMDGGNEIGVDRLGVMPRGAGPDPRRAPEQEVLPPLG